MRRFDTHLHSRLYTQLCGLAVPLLLTLGLTLAAAGSAYGEESVQVRRQAAIQKILDDNAGDPDGMKNSIQKIFGDVQGDDAVVRTRQILDALPPDISDEDWEAIKAALSEKAGQLVSPAASQMIVEKLAAKESELGKTHLLAIADTDESGDEVETARKSSSPLAPPPQTEVVCVSENC